jgi:hypothetical protein
MRPPLLHIDMQSVRGILAVVLIVCCPTILAAQDSPAPLPDVVEYNRDIRPILSDNCFFCHGPDKNKREAELRLDTHEGLHGSGDKVGVLVPGQPDESALFQRITSSDADLKMPPAKSGKSLSERDIQLLKKWIEQGGQYEGHWAFLPIRQEETTTVAAPDTSTTGNTVSDRIDDYVAQMLSEHNLQPSPEADRITLLRRLNFDLIGLPPSEQEVREFLEDQSPDAYEKQVDRLLNSPHYGETPGDVVAGPRPLR